MEHDEDELQSKDWSLLYDDLKALMASHGTEDPFGNGDYWILDENWGPRQHKICVFNLEVLRPYIASEVRVLLRKFPGWAVMFAVDVPGTENEWPPMGIIVREHEIIDGLQRQYFPPKYQSIQYEGSRVGTDQD